MNPTLPGPAWMRCPGLRDGRARMSLVSRVDRPRYATDGPIPEPAR